MLHVLFWFHKCICGGIKKLCWLLDLSYLSIDTSGLSPFVSRLKRASLYRTSVSFSEANFDAFQMASFGDLAVTMVDPEGLFQSWYTLLFSPI